MKVNPWGLAPTRYEEKADTFQDDDGAAFEIRLRNTDGIGFFQPESLLRKWLKEFGSEGEFPLYVPTPDGEVVVIEEEAATQIAQIIPQQAAAANGDEPYDLLGWVGWAKRRPDVWLSAVRMSNELTREEIERLGKRLKGPGEPPSEPS